MLYSPKRTSGPVTGYELISEGGMTSGNAGLFYKRNLHLRGSAASWECPALPVYVYFISSKWKLGAFGTHPTKG